MRTAARHASHRTALLGRLLCAACVLTAVAAAVPPATAANVREICGSSVVGLRITHQAWDEHRPWAKGDPATRSAFGVLLDERHVLTTAQMIAGATLVRLEAFGRPTSVGVRVAHVDVDLDLALLALETPLPRLRPAPLASATPASGLLSTVRWSNGQLEVAATRIKHFEVAAAHTDRLEYLQMLVETDLAGGGWSEPVFSGERLVGLTMSQNERRGRVVPVEILARFIAQTRTGAAPRGFPVLGISWQTNDDPAATAYLGLTGEPRGVLVRDVPWGSSGCGALKPRDILLSLDGHPIDSSGYYSDPRFGQLRFTGVVMNGHSVGDVLPAEVLRDGQQRRVELKLRAAPNALDLIPYERGAEPPPYFVGGGLVFRELDGNYLRAWGDEWISKGPLILVALYNRESAAQTPERRRVIILSSVLPAEYNVGYQDLRDLPVERINGRPIDSLAEVAEAFARPEGRFHTIILAPNLVRHEIVLDAGSFEAATEQILQRYEVPERLRLALTPPPDPGPPCAGSGG
jgi:hypothetical protein